MTSARMDFFGLPDQLAALEHPVAEPALEVQRLVTRAWYLRQRDTGAALADTKTAQDLLGALPIDDAQRASGRLTLVRAENAWLFGELDKARGLLDEARQIFQWARDPVGLGDCHLCEASQLETQAPERLSALHAAGAAYCHAAEGGDAIRLMLAEVWSLSLQVASPSHDDPAPWADRLALAARLGHPGIDHFVAVTRAALASSRGRRIEAIEQLHAAFQAAQAAGQLFSAIALANDIGQSFGHLGDEEGALQWVQLARDLVQATGWPHAASRSLVQSAMLHLGLGREQAARELLMNGLPALQRFPVSLDYVQAAQVLGQALLALREPQDALSWIEVAARVAMQLRLHREVGASLCLKAHALSQLGRADEALAAAKTALHTLHAQPDARREAGILHVIAEVARAHGLAMPADPQQPAEQEVNAAMHHLRKAFALVERVPGFFVPPSWHVELSQDHEAVGNLALALQHQRLATAGLEQLHRQQAADLTAALQMRQRIESEFVTAAQRRALAQASRERVALMENHQDTLERLALVHQELALSVDSPSLFAALGRQVGVLLDAHSVAVWQLQDPAGDVLGLAWGVDDEQPMSPATLPAGNGGSPPWQCLRAQRELQLDGPTLFLPDLAAPAPKAPAHGSALLLPLRAGGEALGVLVLQSRHAGVYGERQRHVPRCLAAAVAQALAGLAHRERLARADTDLDHQRLEGLFTHTGKLAAVARLATQVAREMDPPLAALAGLAGTLTTALEQRHLPGPAASAHSLHREVERLRQLARRLRNVADTGSPQLTQGNVRNVFDEARGLYAARLATEHIVCDEAIPPLTVQADTERLSLTIANLVFNAADAMEGRTDKHLWLSAVQRDGEIALSVRDNGPGLAGEVSARLFEPFFTTKPEGQGVGLGLVLAAQSVAAMKGRITAGNASEGGAVFTIVLPAAGGAGAT